MQLISEQDYAAVELTNDIDPRITIRPMYFELGFSPSPQIFARQAVLIRLLAMLKELPADYNLLIFDVYRPRAVQSVLFNWMRDQVRKRSPHLSNDENYAEAAKYAAVPSVVGDSYCAPHLSGGAIDLTLSDARTASACDMGTEFDDCTEKAHRDYYLKQSHLSAEEQAIQARRDLLQRLMESVGFVSYQYEWWHFDIGDRPWSQSTGQPEAFGPLFGDHEWPK